MRAIRISPLKLPVTEQEKRHTRKCCSLITRQMTSINKFYLIDLRWNNVHQRLKTTTIHLQIIRPHINNTMKVLICQWIKGNSWLNKLICYHYNLNNKLKLTWKCWQVTWRSICPTTNTLTRSPAILLIIRGYQEKLHATHHSWVQCRSRSYRAKVKRLGTNLKGLRYLLQGTRRSDWIWMARCICQACRRLRLHQSWQVFWGNISNWRHMRSKIGSSAGSNSGNSESQLAKRHKIMNRRWLTFHLSRRSTSWVSKRSGRTKLLRPFSPNSTPMALARWTWKNLLVYSNKTWCIWTRIPWELCSKMKNSHLRISSRSSAQRKICSGSKIFLAHREKGYLTTLSQNWTRRLVRLVMMTRLPGNLTPSTWSNSGNRIICHRPLRPWWSHSGWICRGSSCMKSSIRHIRELNRWLSKKKTVKLSWKILSSKLLIRCEESSKSLGLILQVWRTITISCFWACWTN